MKSPGKVREKQSEEHGIYYSLFDLEWKNSAYHSQWSSISLVWTPVRRCNKHDEVHPKTPPVASPPLPRQPTRQFRLPARVLCKAFAGDRHTKFKCYRYDELLELFTNSAIGFETFSCQTSHVGVSKNRGTLKWMVYNGNPY